MHIIRLASSVCLVCASAAFSKSGRYLTTKIAMASSTSTSVGATMDSYSSTGASAKRFSPARERNRDPILSVLKPKMEKLRSDLGLKAGETLNMIEIAAGGGEHAGTTFNNDDNGGS